MHGAERSDWPLPTAGDLALAAVLTVIALLDVLVGSDWRGPTAVNALAAPSMTVALAWRRTRPQEVLAVVVGVVVCLSLAYGASETWTSVFVLVIAVYSATASADRLALTAVIAAVGVVVHDASDPLIHGFNDALWSSSLLLLSFGAGLAGRRVRLQRDDLARQEVDLARTERQRSSAVAEEERRRISRELHDIISHSLGVVVLQAGAAERVLARDPEAAREVLASIANTGREAIGEMSTLLGLLGAGPLDQREPRPSFAGLEALVDRARAAGLCVTIEASGTPVAVPPAVEVSAYRVVQEGMTNALRYAEHSTVTIRIRHDHDQLHVDVLDTGGGVAAESIGSRRGLVGLRERMSVFGGVLEAGPQSDGGWRLHAVFPLAPA